MWRVWCEWDVGQQDLVFKTEADARKWCFENNILKEVNTVYDEKYVQYLFDKHFLVLKKVRVYES
jgi:hypothetical protein